MRILLAHSFYRLPGGEDRYVRQQMELLSTRHEVELLEASNSDLSGGLETAAQMTYSRRWVERAAKTIHDFRPDVIHLHNPYPALGPSVHIASRRSQVPLVVTVHNYRLRCPNGLMFTEGALCRRCERGFYPSAVVHRCFPNRRQAAGYATSLWLHRFPFRLNDAARMFVSPSRFVRERLLEWGIPEERTVVVPNFVEPGSEDPIPGSFGMFLGRISPEKGLHVLIRALGLAGDPPFRIVGDGPARPEAETLARDVGLANTRFLGRVDVEEVKHLLHESRYLVMPSVWEETFGLSAVEAMAHGKPVLVSAIGALPELVREDVGLTCAPGDSGDLAEKIRFLERDDAFCREAGARGLERFRAEYSPQVHLARLEAVYRSCLERPDRRGPGTAPDAPPSG